MARGPSLGFGRRLFLKAQFGVERMNKRIREKLATGDPNVPLERVQRRLELLLTAVYGRAIPIAPTENDVWTRERVRRLASRDARDRELPAGVDGETIFLPPQLGAEDGDPDAITRYRLFALEQAERIARGTARHVPHNDPLERDLYLLREGAAIDAHIAQQHPGVVDTLSEERNIALARRPNLNSLTSAERAVELELRQTLSTRPGQADTTPSDSAASLEWAREMARKIRREGVPYRGLSLASLWGTVRSDAKGTPSIMDGIERHRLRTGNAEASEQESKSGTASEGTGSSPSDNKPESQPEDANGRADADLRYQTRGHDRNAAPPDNRRGAAAGEDPFRSADAGTLEVLPPAIYYDEWDSVACTYATRAAAVRLYDSPDGDAQWSTDMLARHAALVRQIRHHFERLRARRTLLGRQRAGDELDLTACVNAIVDRRIGHPPDDRLYLDARPARRGVAISLLVDVSGSTETRVTDELRIVDLERIALLLAGEALDALGDLYSVHAFAGKNISNVKVTTIKSFAERNGEMVRRRISAMQPGGFTRLGAAVRHVTHQLARQSAGHRLLLILSDGRPNDVDRYQGPFGVEDSRQAIMEARASGIFPFCLTVDRDASEYLPRIFGTAGHTVLQRAEQLPTALLRVVQGLLRRA